MSRAQVEQYQANADTAACQTILSQLDRDGAGTAGAVQAEDQAGAGGSGAEINVQGGAANVDVQQSAPLITIEQPESQVSVQQAQPEVFIYQPAPRVSIEIPPPQITFRIPPPDVNVDTPEPQVSVNQADPEVRIVRSPDDATSDAVATATANTPEPIIRYETEEAQVVVTQADEPVIRVDNSAEGDQFAADQAGSQTDPNAQGTGQQAMTGGGVPVQQIHGMELVGGEAEMTTIGTVSAVIVDTRDRPFVIVDRGNDEVAVMVEYVRLENDRLVLEEFVDANQFPSWDRNGDAAQEVEELSADQTIDLRQAG